MRRRRGVQRIAEDAQSRSLHPLQQRKRSRELESAETSLAFSVPLPTRPSPPPKSVVKSSSGATAPVGGSSTENVNTVNTGTNSTATMSAKSSYSFDDEFGDGTDILLAVDIDSVVNKRKAVSQVWQGAASRPAGPTTPVPSSSSTLTAKGTFTASSSSSSSSSKIMDLRRPSATSMFLDMGSNHNPPNSSAGHIANMKPRQAPAASSSRPPPAQRPTPPPTRTSSASSDSISHQQYLKQTMAAKREAAQLKLKLKQLRKQQNEKDGVLELLRKRLTSAENEKNQLEQKLAAGNQEERRFQQQQTQRLQREIRAMRMERSAQEVEMQELDRSKQALYQALTEERRQLAELKKTLLAYKSKHPQTESSANGAGQDTTQFLDDDEAADMEELFAVAKSSRQGSSQTQKPLSRKGGSFSGLSAIAPAKASKPSSQSPFKLMTSSSRSAGARAAKQLQFGSSTRRASDSHQNDHNDQRSLTSVEDVAMTSHHSTFLGGGPDVVRELLQRGVTHSLLSTDSPFNDDLSQPSQQSSEQAPRNQLFGLMRSLDKLSSSPRGGRSAVSLDFQPHGRKRTASTALQDVLQPSRSSVLGVPDAKAGVPPARSPSSVSSPLASPPTATPLAAQIQKQLESTLALQLHGQLPASALLPLLQDIFATATSSVKLHGSAASSSASSPSSSSRSGNSSNSVGQLVSLTDVLFHSLEILTSLLRTRAQCRCAVVYHNSDEETQYEMSGGYGRPYVITPSLLEPTERRGVAPKIDSNGGGSVPLDDSLRGVSAHAQLVHHPLLVDELASAAAKRAHGHKDLKQRGLRVRVGGAHGVFSRILVHKDSANLATDKWTGLASTGLPARPHHMSGTYYCPMMVDALIRLAQLCLDVPLVPALLELCLEALLLLVRATPSELLHRYKALVIGTGPSGRIALVGRVITQKGVSLKLRILAVSLLREMLRVRMFLPVLWQEEMPAPSSDVLDSSAAGRSRSTVLDFLYKSLTGLQDQSELQLLQLQLNIVRLFGMVFARYGEEGAQYLLVQRQHKQAVPPAAQAHSGKSLRRSRRVGGDSSASKGAQPPAHFNFTPVPWYLRDKVSHGTASVGDDDFDVHAETPVQERRVLWRLVDLMHKEVEYLITHNKRESRCCTSKAAGDSVNVSAGGNSTASASPQGSVTGSQYNPTLNLSTAFVEELKSSRQSTRAHQKDMLRVALIRETLLVCIAMVRSTDVALQMSATGTRHILLSLTTRLLQGSVHPALNDLSEMAFELRRHLISTGVLDRRESAPSQTRMQSQPPQSQAHAPASASRGAQPDQQVAANTPSLGATAGAAMPANPGHEDSPDQLDLFTEDVSMSGVY